MRMSFYPGIVKKKRAGRRSVFSWALVWVLIKAWRCLRCQRWWESLLQLWRLFASHTFVSLGFTTESRLSNALNILNENMRFKSQEGVKITKKKAHFTALLSAAPFNCANSKQETLWLKLHNPTAQCSYLSEPRPHDAGGRLQLLRFSLKLLLFKSRSQVSECRMEIIAYPSGLTGERLYTCSGTSRGWLFQKIAQNLLMDHSVEKLMEPMKRHAAEAPRARRRDEPPSTQLQLGDSRAGWQKAPISSRPEWALNTMTNVHHSPDDGQQDGNAAPLLFPEDKC